MLWETKAHVIVMVTNEVEGDKLKCHRYWPSDTEGEVRVEWSGGAGCDNADTFPPASNPAR